MRFNIEYFVARQLFHDDLVHKSSIRANEGKNIVEGIVFQSKL